MDPIVVSPTIQDYLCGFYFQHKASRLHRVVWQSERGPVPEGHHVHHVNGDRADNRLANLELMDGSDHVGLHAAERTPARVAAAQRALPRLIAGNARLTAEQRAEAARLGWLTTKRDHLVICQTCGCEVLTPVPSRTKFCGLNCRQAAVRARKRAARLQQPGMEPAG